MGYSGSFPCVVARLRLASVPPSLFKKFATWRSWELTCSINLTMLYEKEFRPENKV